MLYAHADQILVDGLSCGVLEFHLDTSAGKGRVGKYISYRYVIHVVVTYISDYIECVGVGYIEDRSG